MAGLSPLGGGASPGPVLGGGQMTPGGPGGGQLSPQQPPMQFGPESLFALLMSMMMGGPAQMGQAAGSGTAVGQGSLMSILPQLMSILQPQQGAQPGPIQGGGQMSPGGPGGGMMSPGGPGGSMSPISSIIQMLSQLGMGGGGQAVMKNGPRPLQ